MARSVDTVNAQIVDTLVANFASIGITIDPTKWSKRNMLRMICYAFATCGAYIEQLMDVLKALLEWVANRSAAASNLWIQKKMFEFQYDAADPQVVQLIDTVPQYPVVDETKRVITACSVKSTSPNVVTIKVATGDPFVALDNTVKASAQGYIDTIGTSGIKYDVVSLESDKIYIAADVYYQGQYSAVVQATVIAALRLFLQNLSHTIFDGSVKMTDLENVIRSVPGVNDVVLQNVRGRADTDLFAAGIDLVLNTAIIQRLWNTIAGYVGEEDTAGKTFADSLNFIAE